MRSVNFRLSRNAWAQPAAFDGDPRLRRALGECRGIKQGLSITGADFKLAQHPEKPSARVESFWSTTVAF